MEVRLDNLNLDGLEIYQYYDGYNFTSDSVLLANFVKAKKSDICLEIGTGGGVVSILVNYKNKPKKIYAFEIQKKYCDLANLNINHNNMQNIIEVINDGIQNYKQYGIENVDVIFCNPPYFKKDVSIKNKNKEIAICKYEDCLTLNELIDCSSKLLKYGGKFFIVYPAERVSELICTMSYNKLEPKKMFFVQPTQNKNANTVLIECVKNGKKGIRVLPTLITNNLDGEYVQTIQKLYRDRKWKWFILLLLQ